MQEIDAYDLPNLTRRYGLPISPGAVEGRGPVEVGLGTDAVVRTKAQQSS